MAYVSLLRNPTVAKYLLDELRVALGRMDNFFMVICTRYHRMDDIFMIMHTVSTVMKKPVNYHQLLS